MHDEINAVVRTPATYTIEQCVKDWLDSIERDAGRSAVERAIRACGSACLVAVP